MSIVRKKPEEIPPMSAERAEQIRSLSDEDIDYSEIPPLDEEFFQKARRVESRSPLSPKHSPDR